MYAVATRITFICPMMFNSFPLDVQVCHFKVGICFFLLSTHLIRTKSLICANFQVGSFNYPINKMIFRDEFIADEKNIRSVLDYNVGINELSKEEKRYSAITGELGTLFSEI